MLPPPPPPPVPPPIAPSARLLLPKSCPLGGSNGQNTQTRPSSFGADQIVFLAILDAKTPKFLPAVDTEGLKRMLADPRSIDFRQGEADAISKIDLVLGIASKNFIPTAYKKIEFKAFKNSSKTIYSHAGGSSL